jgi:hypothetical protein
MKKKLLLLSMGVFGLTSFSMWSQAIPKITSLTDTQIIGNGTPNAIIHIKPANANATIDITIPADGIINSKLNNLTSGIDAIIWETFEKKDSDKIVKPILSNSEMVAILSDKKYIGDKARANFNVSQKLIAEDLLMKSTVATYKRTILNSNFTIPVARFDIIKPQYDTAGNLISDTKGSISLFSSFGFGIGVCGGRSDVTRDSSGIIIDESFSNTFGAYLGILYQATTGEDQRNVFAPTFSLSILDVQVGIGYDYGKVPLNQERTFITVSYGIPLFKLFKTNHRVWLDTQGQPISVKRI